MAVNVRKVRGDLGHTTDLAVVAHPDDLELLVPGVIGVCRDDPDRSFTGVVCTTGAAAGDDTTAAARTAEQQAAAEVGRYGALVLLGRSSADVVSGSSTLVEALARLLDEARPTNLYTHNLVDKHDTHVAVTLAVVAAARSLPLVHRPWRTVGVEAWRDLDWLGDDEKVRLDVTGHEALARDLLGSFPSQLADKRYDLAAAGRRRANATFADPRTPDAATETIHAMDLSDLVRNDDLDPAAYVAAAIDRFRTDALGRIDRLGRPAS